MTVTREVIAEQECPVCHNGTIEQTSQEYVCRGECGSIFPLSGLITPSPDAYMAMSFELDQAKATIKQLKDTLWSQDQAITGLQKEIKEYQEQQFYLGEPFKGDNT